jgi:hypothetical protein
MKDQEDIPPINGKLVEILAVDPEIPYGAEDLQSYIQEGYEIVDISSVALVEPVTVIIKLFGIKIYTKETVTMVDRMVYTLIKP